MGGVATKSALLLARLNGLPDDAVQSWQDALKLDRHQAAMSVIESAAFFDDANQFQDDAFRKAVEAQKAARKRK